MREQLISLQVDLEDKEKVCEQLQQKVEVERVKLGRIEADATSEYERILQTELQAGQLEAQRLRGHLDKLMQSKKALAAECQLQVEAVKVGNSARAGAFVQGHVCRDMCELCVSCAMCEVFFTLTPTLILTYTYTHRTKTRTKQPSVATCTASSPKTWKRRGENSDEGTSSAWQSSWPHGRTTKKIAPVGTFVCVCVFIECVYTCLFCMCVNICACACASQFINPCLSPHPNLTPLPLPSPVERLVPSSPVFASSTSWSCPR